MTTACRDRLAMTALLWMCRKERCAPNVGSYCFGALEQTDSKVPKSAIPLGSERPAAFRISREHLEWPGLGRLAVAYGRDERLSDFGVRLSAAERPQLGQVGNPTPRIPLSV